jgi:ribosome-associated protein
MTQEAAAKKDTQRLQRAIVDGLEDVKAQDIQVYNTEHLSPLFERVIIATGSSNRQTKALAASVRDAVREAGFPKPRVEGEDNGEWIIVDCGAAVAHVMQPGIRTYYHLEEIWGEKPVRLKFGAPKPAEASEPEPAAAPRKGAAKKAAPEPTLRRSSAAKTAVKAAEQAAREAKAAPRKAPAKKVVVKAPTRKAPAGKSVTGKPAARKTAPGRAAPGKAPAKKTASKAPSRKA